MPLYENIDFIWGQPFRDDQRNLTEEASDELVADVQHFEQVFRGGPREYLGSAYIFKQIHAEPGRYKLWQAYLIGNKYRGILMIPDGIAECHWIALFKKTRQRNQNEIELAISTAKDYWSERIEPKLRM